MSSSFKCVNCGCEGQAEQSCLPGNAFVQAPWYSDDDGNQHECYYCRNCGTVHDALSPPTGLLKSVFGREPARVVGSYRPAVFKLRAKTSAGPVPFADIHPLILEAMVQDRLMTEKDTNELGRVGEVGAEELLRMANEVLRVLDHRLLARYRKRFPDESHQDHQLRTTAVLNELVSAPAGQDVVDFKRSHADFVSRERRSAPLDQFIRKGVVCYLAARAGLGAVWQSPEASEWASALYRFDHTARVPKSSDKIRDMLDRFLSRQRAWE